MFLNYQSKFLEAIQFYGDFNTGYDGEYSTRTKWLDNVISESAEGVKVKLFNKDYVDMNPNDWIIYNPASYQVIDKCSDDEFTNKYLPHKVNMDR